MHHSVAFAINTMHRRFTLEMRLAARTDASNIGTPVPHPRDFVLEAASEDHDVRDDEFASRTSG